MNAILMLRVNQGFRYCEPGPHFVTVGSANKTLRKILSARFRSLPVSQLSSYRTEVIAAVLKNPAIYFLL